ncbi:DUF4296 domain-containing protein [Bizionia saleffrena]|uniref:DUF4296 domain-containing protein n=1 Tax=Bizionia saleffrena TaxID=291189 RepID=A0A8H2LAR4_9FLAO|nr:DUF4296 domain-containing protein [Bizionia saleffrena]TYB70667.1 DUF4296 domain-containing protein [Bizionia saleffrena]
MKTHFFLCVLALFVLSGCYDVERPEKPNNLLSEDQMVAVISDMAILSSAKGVNKKRIEENGIVPDQYIYKRNNIDSLSFAASNVYYAFDIETYNRIYTRVKDTLNKKKEFFQAIQEREKEEKSNLDSLKRSKLKKDRSPVKDSLAVTKGFISPN